MWQKTLPGSETLYDFSQDWDYLEKSTVIARTHEEGIGEADRLWW